MNRYLAIVLMGFFLSTAAFAQKTNATVLGKWKGESLCTVKPSPCHDEVVVYEITSPTGASDKLLWKADKIVNGKQENMGTLDCTYASSTRTLTCKMAQGTWELIVNGDTMNGILKLPDGTLYRKISVKRM